MGRYGNYPTTVEDCLYLSIKKLKEWDYLTNNGTKSGTISWSRNGTPHSNVRITITKSDFKAFMILDYSVNGEPKNYKVEIISKPSNLGKGEVLYFVCPSTKQQCRKLHLQCGYFLHRSAFQNLMYSKQIESKKFRYLGKVFDYIFNPDEIYQERYKKYFKTHYKGKPTKRYLRVKKKIDLIESCPPNMEEILLMM